MEKNEMTTIFFFFFLNFTAMFFVCSFIFGRNSFLSYFQLYFLKVCGWNEKFLPMYG